MFRNFQVFDTHIVKPGSIIELIYKDLTILDLMVVSVEYDELIVYGKNVNHNRSFYDKENNQTRLSHLLNDDANCVRENIENYKCNKKDFNASICTYKLSISQLKLDRFYLNLK